MSWAKLGASFSNSIIALYSIFAAIYLEIAVPDLNAYDDDYATCYKTSAAFRIMHADLNPDTVSRELGLQPDWAYHKGQPRGGRNTPSKFGNWGFETDNKVVSRDLRHHLDWLLDVLEPHRARLFHWQQKGYNMDIFCMWVKASGTGGPTLSPRNMARLANLNLLVSIEFWNHEDEDEDMDE